MRKIFICFFVLVIIFSCAMNNGITKLNKNWSLLIESNTVEEEMTKIEEMKSQIIDLKGYYTIFIINSAEKRISYNDFNWQTEFASVDIEVSIENKIVVLSGWIPKSKDNIFIWVLE
jgi:hypothetical protein